VLFRSIENWKWLSYLPEGLIEIRDYAFDGCRSLKRINIPSTVEEIGEQAFDYCVKLDGITLPEGLQRLGEEAFSSCESLQRINIPSNIERIERGVFLFCSSLSEVVLLEGLEVIGKDAFSGCKSLESVTLPSSLKVVGIEAFEGCPRLNEIYTPDTIESIEDRAFKNCNLTNFLMPSSIGNDVDISIVGRNTSLVSLELSETVEQLLDYHDSTEEQTVLNVRNIAVPPACEIHIDLLKTGADLGLAFPDRNIDRMIEALQQRFDDLPIHKICYYQSYNSNFTSDQLNNSTEIKISQRRSKINPTGKQQDCLGMTPLHILACSTKPTIEMFRLLIDKYPETLIMEDKWGEIPLMYAIWCNAPTEILDLLVASYKSLYPEYEFDWSGMLLTLAKRNVPLANIQKLITTQQKSFPDQEYDMQQVTTELARFDAIKAILYKPYTPIETFIYLLRASITDRLDILGIRRWRIDLENCIKSLPEEGKNKMRETRAVYDRLATYESIKEGTSILELALWKAKIDDNSRNKRARVGEGVSYKEQCRVNCGADIVIRNVLPYLLPE